MSAAGLKAMQEELEYLKTVRRKELAEEINEAGCQSERSRGYREIMRRDHCQIVPMTEPA